MTTGMGSVLATPRPWHVHQEDCCGVIYGPIADGSAHLAEVFAGPGRQANRSLILEAVNAYDRLRAVEAAARAVTASHYAPGPNRITRRDTAMAVLRAALDPATTEPKEPE